MAVKCAAASRCSFANAVNSFTTSSPLSKMSAYVFGSWSLRIVAFMLVTSHDLAHTIAENRPRDVFTVRLAAQERLRKLRRLLDGDLGGERRLERLDHGMDDGGAGMRQRLGGAPRGLLGDPHAGAGHAAR